MLHTDQAMFHWVSLGWEKQVMGQHHLAYKCFMKALVYNPGHSLARNALAESMFLLRDYLKAAENFYQAAVFDFTKINSELILTDQPLDQQLEEQQKYNIDLAETISKGYAEKTGIALLAHQHDNPVKRTSLQIYINRYRNKIDFYGYSNFEKIDPYELKKMEEMARDIGYDFMDVRNRKRRAKKNDEFALEAMMKCLNLRP